MGRNSQKEIAKKLIEAVDLMWFFDDGQHINEYAHLVWITNDLYSRLNETNQKKFHDWIAKKIQ